MAMESTIRSAIERALTALGADVSFSVEHPADLAHGDFATNAALTAAKSLGKNPREVATELADMLLGIDGVASVEIAGPGFINFHLTRAYLTDTLATIRENAAVWGRSADREGTLVVVEYTDPNPFKEFHVGHLFTNTVGESIARLFMMTGATVKRVNYQGDVGMHVAHVLWGMREMGLTPETGFTARDLGKAYALGATAYKERPEVADEMRRINRAIYERNDEELNRLYDTGREVSLAYFESIYTILGTAFDYYFFESDAAPKGKELVLAHPEIFPESDGARVFCGEDYGLHTRVFLNAEGLPTYEAKELALAKMKYDIYPYDLSIISTSNEITEYFKVLRTAMGKIYPDLAAKTEHIGHGTVRLKDGKMSSRTGKVIAAVDFIDEIAAAATAKAAESGTEDFDDALARTVAIGAIKYATLRSNVLQDSTFDPEQALSFEGDSGPYLQYTHARIVSVLEKARGAAVLPNSEHAPEVPYAIERLLYRFPEVVARACAERSPHHVAIYLTELAGAFNSFYADERIADPEDVYAPYKAAIADVVRITLQNGLFALGIEAPKRM
jgi:arginyl-tRNA synthetase